MGQIKIENQTPNWLVDDLKNHWDREFYNKLLQYDRPTAIKKLLNNEIKQNSKENILMYLFELYRIDGCKNLNFENNDQKNMFLSSFTIIIDSCPQYSQSFNIAKNLIQL